MEALTRHTLLPLGADTHHQIFSGEAGLSAYHGGSHVHNPCSGIYCFMAAVLGDISLYLPTQVGAWFDLDPSFAMPLGSQQPSQTTPQPLPSWACFWPPIDTYDHGY
jgi:hypothetical protein